jgi:hypothetical protein
MLLENTGNYTQFEIWGSHAVLGKFCDLRQSRLLDPKGGATSPLKDFN